MDRKKLNIKVFYALAMLQGMVFYGPIATLYRQAKGLSVFDITLIESISLVVMIALEVPWGMLADKIGYKKTMVLCNIMFFVSKIVFYKAESFTGFLLERLLLSIILSGLSGCDSAYLYLCAGGKASHKVFGRYNAMSTAGLIFASAIFSLFVKDNYKLSALLTVITYGIAMGITLLLTEVKPQQHEKNSFGRQLTLLSTAFSQNKRFMLFLLASALLEQSNQTITVFLSQLQYVRSGIAPQYLGYIYILVTVCGLLSAYSHVITVKMGEKRALVSLFFLAGLSCTSMALFASAVISLLGIVLLRVAASMFVPLRMDIENRQVTIDDRATMLSLYSVVMNAIAVLTNLLFGKMAGISLSAAMGAGAAFCFVGCAIYWISQYRSRSGNV